MQAAVEPRENEQQRVPGGGLLGTVLRIAFFWWLMNYLKGNSGGPKQPTMPNLFSRGELVDVHFYFSESKQLVVESLETEPDWGVSDVQLGTHEAVSKNVTLRLPEGVQNNGSLFLHVFVVRKGHDFERHNAFFGVHQLTRHGPKRKEVKEKNLLFEGDGEEAKEDEEEGPLEVVNYWKPSLTIAMVDDFSRYSKNSVPVHLRHLWRPDPDGDFYYPMVYFNEFWLLKSHMAEINSTVEEVDIELTLSTIRPWIVQLIAQMEESLRMQESMGLNSGEDSDQFKKILVEGNPVLLAVTFVVSLLHSVFDFLAFKNDIGFWKNNRSMEGLSARSILINAGCQVIIFLYLLDNDTSFVILLSSGVGLLIELWKVTKAMQVTVDWSRGFPVPRFQDRASYVDSETKKHDAQAMRYLSYVLYPLVIGYSIYALVKESHKSWYSWILSSLVGAVYAFGFILMCPQLYLNYKLKSVAHLPWRQLTYKFLNTIIDDLFAFVITMPWMHRLSVFRDDVVFAIYLYQWYIYGVDKSRVNEFGFSEDAAGQTEAIAEATAETEDDGAPDGLRRRRTPAEDAEKVEEVEPPKLHGPVEDSKKDK